jgi:cystathionine beta-lyase
MMPFFAPSYRLQLKMKPSTTLVSAGRNPRRHSGAVNVPAFRASTITAPDLATWEASRNRRFEKDAVVYGRWGTPASQALEDAVAAIEGADRAVSLSSGMAACASAILSVVKTGDHLLVPDNVYQPVRGFANGFLKEFGVEVTFYDPLVGSGITKLMRPNTRLLYLEAPGSQTMEMPDTRALVAEAKARNIRTAFDNTWGTPLLFRPLDHGIDLSINAATKYYVGHSDAMLGMVAMREELFERVKTVATAYLGICAGSEEIYLGLRGLRTMGVRLKRHGENAFAVARWFQTRPEVERVLYPALPEDPGHAIWKRDFAGASGLFSVVFKPCAKAALARFVDGLEHFSIGASFGGFESLVLPFDPGHYRTVTKWEAKGPCLRFHIGLEDVDDLIEDLERGFSRMRAAA